MCHEILLTFVTESLCKKGIVISTSDLLPESQVSEHITCMDSKSVNRLVKNPNTHHSIHLSNQMPKLLIYITNARLLLEHQLSEGK